jgi:hypothetical protein
MMVAEAFDLSEASTAEVYREGLDSAIRPAVDAAGWFSQFVPHMSTLLEALGGAAPEEQFWIELLVRGGHLNLTRPWDEVYTEDERRGMEKGTWAELVKPFTIP